jgi:hypothetical protein
MPRTCDLRCAKIRLDNKMYCLQRFWILRSKYPKFSWEAVQRRASRALWEGECPDSTGKDKLEMKVYILY